MSQSLFSSPKISKAPSLAAQRVLSLHITTAVGSR